MPTAIEWTDDTWNPVTGCTRVSPGCAHCYIERQTPMRIAHRKFARVGNASTTGVQLHPERLARVPKGPKVFVCSMSDLFHEDVPDDYIDSVFNVMGQHPDRTFQVLTKRPERAKAWFDEWWHCSFDQWQPHPNVWLGVTIENARYTWRADVLREIPAAVRFISAEPLLGSLFSLDVPGADVLRDIDWIIAGGESGPVHRPMQLEWAREVRDACRAFGVAFFFKQVGGKTPKSNGKLLDGHEWCEFPRTGLGSQVPA